MCVWVGHLGHMREERLPKNLLFGKLEKKRPCHGTKKMWHDGLKSNLQATEIGGGWYDLAREDLCGASPAMKALKVNARKPMIVQLTE